jgi:hypothetical protein
MSKLVLAESAMTTEMIINIQLLITLALLSIYCFAKAIIGGLKCWKLWNQRQNYKNLRELSMCQGRIDLHQEKCLSPPVIRRLQELEKYRSVMTRKEYIYQRQLIIYKYTEDQKNGTVGCVEAVFCKSSKKINHEDWYEDVD